MGSWFDLSRYPDAELKALDLDSWGQQFEIRRRLLHHIEFPALHENSLSLRDWCLDRLRDAPLSIGAVMPRIITSRPVTEMAHEEVRAQQWLYEQPGIRAMVESWDSKLGGSDVGARVLTAGFSQEESSGGVRGVAAHRELLAALTEPPTNAASSGGARNAVRFLQVAYAGVDFSFSSEVLIEHFTQWVEQKRAAFQAAGIPALAHAKNRALGKKPRVILNEASRDKWISQRVLPYLDISIRAAEDGLDMPPAKILADTLFLGLYAGGGDEKVKIFQRLKPLAERVLDPDVIERLILDGQARRLGSEN